MFKKITAVTALLAMLLPTFSFAAEPAQKTEISFKVGDSVLSINGKDVEVTAPYIVGVGTTLVPVRVITEAFGAEVEWVGETKTVNLKYLDVNISISIGSKAAVVNTHSETLEAAPELYNDTTMVPLRFISETFGAKVTYDNADKRITVTKEKAVQEGQTVEGTTDKEYIGDSYYKWTIKNPKMLKMTEKSFDCTGITFADDEESNSIAILIDNDDEPYDIDTEFNNLKNTLSQFTISAAEKNNTPSGYTKLHVRAKGKEQSMDISRYIKDKRRYTVIVLVENESEMKDDLFDIADSFAIGKTVDYYDLSNVENDKRLFDDSTMKVKAEVPADWVQMDTERENFVDLSDPNHIKHYMQISFYSKSDTVNAQKLAENDRAITEAAGNKELCDVSEIMTAKVSGVPCVYYTVQYKGTGEYSYVMNDTFVDIGDYVYNITACGESEIETHKLINSVKIETLNPEEVGTIIREQDITGTSKLSIGSGKVSAPDKWLSMTPESIVDAQTGASVSLMTIDTDHDVNEIMKAYIKQRQEDDDASYEEIGTRTSRTENGNTYYKATLLCDVEADKKPVTCYQTVYVMKKGKTVYIFIYMRNDIYYKGSTDEEAENIIYSYTE